MQFITVRILSNKLILLIILLVKTGKSEIICSHQTMQCICPEAIILRHLINQWLNENNLFMYTEWQTSEHI